MGVCFWAVVLLMVQCLWICSIWYQGGTEQMTQGAQGGSEDFFFFKALLIHSGIVLQSHGAAKHCLTDTLCQYIFCCNFLYRFDFIQPNTLAFGLYYPTCCGIFGYLFSGSFLNDRHLFLWKLTRSTILLSDVFERIVSETRICSCLYAFSVPWYCALWSGLVNWSTEKFSWDDPTPNCRVDPSRQKWMSLQDCIILFTRQVIGIRITTETGSCVQFQKAFLYCLGSWALSI